MDGMNFQNPRFNKPDRRREAIERAIDLELARIPPKLSRFFDRDDLVNTYLNGGSDDDFLELISMGDPSSEVPEDQRWIQDHMLQGFTSEGWTPNQVELFEAKHGYNPIQGNRLTGEMAISPGAKMLGGIRARKEVLLGLPEGTPEQLERLRQDAADRYLDDPNRENWRFSDLQNPETAVGSYITKMGPVLSDVGSQFATALLGYGNADESLGNAAVRSAGSDWNRRSPQLKEFKDWRSAQGSIDKNRAAYASSEGMDSTDTLRATTGHHSLPVEMAMSLGNGMLDGSVGAAPGGGWRALGMELAEEAATDLPIQAAVMTVPEMQESRAAKLAESQSEFRDRLSDEAQSREQATKVLEASNDQINRPETWTSWAGKKISPVLSPLLSGEAKPVLGTTWGTRQ